MRISKNIKHLFYYLQIPTPKVRVIVVSSISKFIMLLHVRRNMMSNIPLSVLVNNQLDAQFFSVYVYFDTIHASSNHVLIIRRINCINTTSGICHLHRVTYAKCRIDTIHSPDDEHIVARNM